MTKRDIRKISPAEPEPSSELEYAQILLPPKVAAALAEVVNYLWDAEYHDYRGRTQEEREGHVFPKLLRVRRWASFPVARPRCPRRG